MTTYIQDILADSGLVFVVEVAQNGFEAGVKIHGFAPDVILLNFMLPDADAFRMCSLIKGDVATGHISVIAIAGDLSAGNVSRMLEAGAEAFLAKPFTPQDLLGLLSHTAGARKNLPGARAGISGEATQLVNQSGGSETLLFSLTRMAEARNSFKGQDNATRLANRVAIFGRSLARLGPEELQALRNVCELHDVGNLGIPDSILLKPGTLPRRNGCWSQPYLDRRTTV